jgi:hypothetical protein
LWRVTGFDGLWVWRFESVLQCSATKTAAAAAMQHASVTKLSASEESKSFL